MCFTVSCIKYTLYFVCIFTPFASIIYQFSTRGCRLIRHAIYKRKNPEVFEIDINDAIIFTIKEDLSANWLSKIMCLIPSIMHRITTDQILVFHKYMINKTVDWIGLRTPTTSKFRIHRKIFPP